MMPAVPYVPDKLSAQQRRELKTWESALAKIEQEREKTRQAYAVWIRETGVSAVARELGVPPGRLEQRVRLYEGKRRRRGSR
jgi:hypothetical protein